MAAPVRGSEHACPAEPHPQSLRTNKAKRQVNACAPTPVFTEKADREEPTCTLRNSTTCLKNHSAQGLSQRESASQAGKDSANSKQRSRLCPRRAPPLELRRVRVKGGQSPSSLLPRPAAAPHRSPPANTVLPSLRDTAAAAEPAAAGHGPPGHPRTDTPACRPHGTL